MPFDATSLTVNAWRRENGRVGVRNHVIILPVDDISNAAAEAVANTEGRQPTARQRVQVSLPAATRIRLKTFAGAWITLNENVPDFATHLEGRLRDSGAHPYHQLARLVCHPCHGRLKHACSQPPPAGMCRGDLPSVD